MSFVEEGQQTRVSFSTEYLIFLGRIWWEVEVVFSTVIGSTLQNTWLKLPVHSGYVTVMIPKLGVLRYHCCYTSILFFPPASYSSPLLRQLGLKILAITSLTLLTNTSPCHTCNPSPFPCELYLSSKQHTQFVPCFGSVNHIWRVVMGEFPQMQWSIAEYVSLWTRDQYCCSLWQIVCDSLSAVTATVSAIAQYSAKALRTAKLLPFPFLPAKVHPSEVIHVSLWYQFLTSLVMRSHSKPVEVSRCLSALVRCCHVHANVLNVLAEPFGLWGYCWVVLL